jgi:type IV pilus assembly protein PilA
MQCPQCGVEVIPGHRFCGLCGQPVTDMGAGVTPARSAYAQALEPETLDMRRPSWVTVVSILDFVFGGLVAALGALWILLGVQGRNEGPVFIGLGVFTLLFGGWVVATGVGLLRLKRWARISQVVISSLGLVQMPCGTLVGAFVLVYLLKPGVKVLFSGRGSDELTPREAVDVASLSQSGTSGGGLSTVAIVIAAVLLPLVLIASIGIIAAIAIPSLLRARIAANEAGAIGTARTIVSAQASYRAQLGGYGTLECLEKAKTCNPSFGGADFIGPDEATATRQGYNRRLLISDDKQLYTFFAVPVTPGGTGIRSFCTDEKGEICAVADGSDPTTENGTCDTSRCRPL